MNFSQPNPNTCRATALAINPAKAGPVVSALRQAAGLVCLGLFELVQATRGIGRGMGRGAAWGVTLVSGRNSSHNQGAGFGLDTKLGRGDLATDSSTNSEPPMG